MSGCPNGTRWGFGVKGSILSKSNCFRLINMRNRVVTAHIPDQLARRLDNLAGRLERPRGWVVKEAIEGYLALDEERHRQTLAALAEVDAGATIDHSEVRAWAGGLAASPRRKSRR